MTTAAGEVKDDIVQWKALLRHQAASPAPQAPPTGVLSLPSGGLGNNFTTPSSGGLTFSAQGGHSGLGFPF